MAQYLMLVISTVVVLAGASLFTNGLEWFGRKLKISDHAIGSVFAAIGTAMPETMVPIIAILFGAKGSGEAVGVGAIIGAPFMLGTLAMFISGCAVLWNKGKRRHHPRMSVNVKILAHDLECFFGFYALAVAASLTPNHTVRLFIASLLPLFYGLYALYAIRSVEKGHHEEGELEPFRFSPKSRNPRLGLILFQLTTSLVLIIWGADLFVEAIQDVSRSIGVSPLLLSLLIVPVATELPEKFNSVIWISKGKDTLALGNISGSMVWQSSVIVVVGILLTDWKLGFTEYLSVLLTFASTGLIYFHLRRHKSLSPTPLLAGGFFYALFMIIIFSRH